MKKKPVDPIDLQILNILQRESNITNVELADRIGLSPPPVLKRVRKLAERRILLDYKAQINLAYFGITHKLRCNIEVYTKDSEQLVHRLIAADNIVNLYQCTPKEPFREVTILSFDVFTRDDATVLLNILLENQKGIVKFEIYTTPKRLKPEVYILSEKDM